MLKAFSISTLGLQAQSHSMNTIGTNIANVTTGGYKGTDTRFSTVLSERRYDGALGGVKPKDTNLITKQGLLKSSARDLDLAIAGQGFLYLNTQLDGSGETLYGRDGAFQMALGDEISVTSPTDGEAITVNEGYLVDKNGYYVQGWEPETDGTFSNSGTMVPIRIDQFAFVDVGQATTNAEIDINLPASDVAGDSYTYSQLVYDSAFAQRSLNYNFTNSSTTNQWHFTFDADNMTSYTLGPQTTFSGSASATFPATFDASAGTIAVSNGTFFGLQAGDTFTVTGSASNDGTYTVGSVADDGATITLSGATLVNETSTASTFGGTMTEPIVFNSDGTLDTPTEYTLNVTWDDASTSSITIDTSGFTQYAGDFTTFRNNQDGFGTSEMKRVTFDEAGHVVGHFYNGRTRKLYKLPLAQFQNADGLEQRNGNVYAESFNSGSATTSAADANGFAVFSPYSLELSNIDLAEEMTKMIITQNAYNSNATVFKTTDEMVTVARDLKR